MSDLKTASPLSLPRSYFFELTDPAVSATLCGFCDTSTKAYAAVVYLVNPQDGDQKLSTVRCSEDKSCTSKEPNHSMAGIAIGTSSRKPQCFCPRQSAAPDPISEHKMLHGFPGGTVLDSWKWQRIKTVRPEPSC